MTNWMPVAKLKRPGMHLLSSLQAVAHGSDTVQYFQWRKSRGASREIPRRGGRPRRPRAHTRLQRRGRCGTRAGETRPRGGHDHPPGRRPDLRLGEQLGHQRRPGTAREGKDYLPTVLRHYRQFWQRGIPVDVIDMEQDLSSYKLVIAPMLYMVRPGVAERIEAFVQAGGTFVATYWSGIVDETDLCFLGGFPGPLRSVLGIWDEEIDALYDGQTNSVVPAAGNKPGTDRQL